MRQVDNLSIIILCKPAQNKVVIWILNGNNAPQRAMRLAAFQIQHEKSNLLHIHFKRPCTKTEVYDKRRVVFWRVVIFSEYMFPE